MELNDSAQPVHYPFTFFSTPVFLSGTILLNYSSITTIFNLSVNYRPTNVGPI